ncbi:Uncharacterized protein HZ326_13781 [Fusarium oxysporum f. sp. albedinis]|nr:Uncharacterized protein HZ326_13781 [Fusarium oxysporum f. sp. albedinis]
MCKLKDGSSTVRVRRGTGRQEGYGGILNPFWDGFTALCSDLVLKTGLVVLMRSLSHLKDKAERASIVNETNDV